uniref:Defensin-B5 n=1 Tax=Ornithorhynchus anatinus TaxID=9258 RepID=DEFB5_ORNAN|nr:RecName: Full=Defensin-B5; Short=DefB5; Short=OaDefB5; Flags: Precursor [Ornithorhynchus anatinus]
MRGLLPFLFLLSFFLSPIQAQPEGREEELEETWSEDRDQAPPRVVEESEVVGAENEAGLAAGRSYPWIILKKCRERGGQCHSGVCSWNEKFIGFCSFARPCCRKRRAVP